MDVQPSRYATATIHARCEDDIEVVLADNLVMLLLDNYRFGFARTALLAAPLALAVSCSAGSSDGLGGGGSAATESSGSHGTSGGFATGAGGGGGAGLTGDPKTCEEASQYRTYLGCDFYPTVTFNQVWDIFDYAVVVANAGDTPAEVSVTRGGTSVSTTTIAPNQLSTIYLPWVPELKGPQFDECTSVVPATASVRSPGGAYHLVSTVPVTVYQFSALEYGPQGGPPGKDWSQCPASACGLDCFSYSNDASLLLPSTALTKNYRVIGYPSWQQASLGSYVAVTGTEDGTTVTVSLSPTGSIVGGTGVDAAGAGTTSVFTLQQGEVVELLNSTPGDLSGSLVQADKPIQVIHGLPCVNIPEGISACDHIEESVFPAETLGQHYLVAQPTGPSGAAVAQVVRFIGNVNGTVLTYPAGMPPGAPTTLAAGQVVDLGAVGQDFEVQGDHEFAVAFFQQGAQVVDVSGLNEGDPAQSIATAVEQYRTKYVFLAPADYTQNFADVLMPKTATLTLDGVNVAATPVPIGSSQYGVARIPLGLGNGGAHVLLSTEPVGLQVLGYGLNTSYQYPGGLNLKEIAPPPPVPQ